jgi:putative flippase GtrA
MILKFKYIFVGLLNTVFSYGIFLVVFRSFYSVILALILANICGVIFSFTANRYLIWKSGNFESLFKFFIIQVLSLIINWIILHFVSLTTIPRELAQVFISGFQAIGFYFINKNYVFKSNL